MKKTRIIGMAVLIVEGGLALHLARAQQPGIKRTDRAPAPTAGSMQGAPVRETVAVAADKPIPNVPGKRLVSHIVDYPQGRVRPRTVTARHSSTLMSSRARSGARSMTSLFVSTGLVRRGSRGPAPIIG